MNRSNKNDFSNSDAEREASDWILCIDRGLSAEEQDAYSQWLASNPSHKKLVALHSWGWDELDRLAGLQTTQKAEVDPDLLAPGNRYARRPHFLRLLSLAVPIAAVIAFILTTFWPARIQKETSFATKSAVELIARIERVALEDGSVIELNRGAVIETEYTSSVRRVRLLSGEANFTVEKDPSRPFVVNVSGLDVIAVGTQFNVRLTNNAVDVIVSEGIVRLDAVEAATTADNIDVVKNTLLEFGDRAIMTLGDEASVEFSALDEAQLYEELRWQPRLMDFDDVPMSEIIAEFNQSNEVQLALGDPSLAEMQLSYSFWSDNVEGFVRLMESSFGIRAEWRNSTEIVLFEEGE
ncbi:FecR domain-containing protein [Puniceicoccaceae bacterium K14]|nr:FecR domain-containing protein [Puniceicoccaceae bacterium K14]